MPLTIQIMKLPCEVGVVFSHLKIACCKPSKTLKAIDQLTFGGSLVKTKRGETTNVYKFAINFS